MNKSIYEVALNILRDSLQDPQDEDNVCYMLNLLQMNVIIGALQQAKKQEELLELYKELITVKDELISIAWFDDECDETEKIETDLEKRIKEIENEIKRII